MMISSVEPQISAEKRERKHNPHARWIALQALAYAILCRIIFERSPAI